MKKISEFFAINLIQIVFDLILVVLDRPSGLEPNVLNIWYRDIFFSEK